MAKPWTCHEAQCDDSNPRQYRIASPKHKGIKLKHLPLIQDCPYQIERRLFIKTKTVEGVMTRHNNYSNRQ